MKAMNRGWIRTIRNTNEGNLLWISEYFRSLDMSDIKQRIKNLLIWEGNIASDINGSMSLINNRSKKDINQSI